MTTNKEDVTQNQSRKPIQTTWPLASLTQKGLVTFQYGIHMCNSLSVALTSKFYIVIHAQSCSSCVIILISTYYFVYCNAQTKELKKSSLPKKHLQMKLSLFGVRRNAKPYGSFNAPSPLSLVSSFFPWH